MSLGSLEVAGVGVGPPLAANCFFTCAPTTTTVAFSSWRIASHWLPVRPFHSPPSVALVCLQAPYKHEGVPEEKLEMMNASPFQLPLVARVGFWALLVLASGVRADSASPPLDYTKATPNGQFELVMLPTARYAVKDADLRKRYRRSGLYRKGAPQRALWTIDWYAWQVYPASDGHHLVRMGPWASSPEDLAVAFYRDGRLVRQFKINQLVKDPLSLPHSVSHFTWSKSVAFNDAKRQLRLSTLSGEKYLFDGEGRLLEGRLVAPYQPKNRADELLHKGDAAGLARLGSAALPELLAAVRTGKGRTQELAFVVLCANGKAALPQLGVLSRDPNPAVRLIAATALTEIAAPEAKPVLLELLRDANIGVRIGAIAGLAQIHEATSGSSAIEAARNILRSGSAEQKQRLLFALNRFRVPALIPDVLPLLDQQERADNGRGQLTERANYWLMNTTFQSFESLEEKPDARQKKAQAWRKWWDANKNRTSDEWFAQAVERDLAETAGPTRQAAIIHLERLSGKSLGMGGNSSSASARWKAWWQSNKGRRPGQVLIDSLLLAPKGDDFPPSDALEQLVLQCDERDVPALVGLYELYSAQKSWGRDYVEVALRHITNIDSFAASFPDLPKTVAAIRAWKQFVPRSNPLS